MADAEHARQVEQSAEYQGTAVFLLSDVSSFMTGADLRIDGGHVRLGRPVRNLMSHTEALVHTVRMY